MGRGQSGRPGAGAEALGRSWRERLDVHVRLAGAAILIVGLLLQVAAPSAASTEEPVSAAAIHTVEVSDFRFSPATLNNVRVGDTIRWVWREGGHTTTSNQSGIPAGAAPWNAPIDPASPPFEYPITKAGKHEYFCAFHADLEMTGTINVVPAAVGPVISNVRVTTVGARHATIRWTTSTPSSSLVQFGPTTAYGRTTGNRALVTQHVVQLVGLRPSTLHHFRVRSLDGSGRPGTSGDFTFTTARPDTRAPAIRAIRALAIGETEATISWITNEPATSRVLFGRTTAYGSSAGDNVLLGNHSVRLTGLRAGTLHHFRVRSVDDSGNVTTSNDFTFRTAQAAP